MKLKLPVGNFRAYLFDCDGTIVDSMPLHYIAWKAALGEWGCEFDEELFYSWGGKPTDVMSQHAERDERAEDARRGRRSVQGELYFDLLPRLKVIPEVVEHIEARHGQIPFAVVSGGRRSSVVRSLTALGLLEKFETIVGADDYTRGKPAPDAFLLAAERLGVAPADCLVFEDTEIGIQAATAAGMASVKVPPPWERN
jgi:HAD superfamily hydrolase (TIGR01509 family)